MCHEPQVDAAVKQAVDKFGRLDIMVANAGKPSPLALQSCTSELARRTASDATTMHTRPTSCCAGAFTEGAAAPRLSQNPEARRTVPPLISTSADITPAFAPRPCRDSGEAVPRRECPHRDLEGGHGDQL